MAKKKEEAAPTTKAPVGRIAPQLRQPRRRPLPAAKAEAAPNRTGGGRRRRSAGRQKQEEAAACRLAAARSSATT